MDSFQQILKVAFELHNAGRHQEAETISRLLIKINPHDGELLFLLGMVLQQTGRSQEALRYLEQAAELQPQSAPIFNGLGFVHQSLQDYSRAMENHAKAIELGLHAAGTFYSMGYACYKLGDVERAVSLFQKAVELNPQYAPSWHNLAKCLKDSHQLEESIVAYDRALAVDPDCYQAGYGRALSLLTASRLQEGFLEYNKWRNHGRMPRLFSQPAWNGEPIPGKTLFLHAEQGFGDAIQTVRFVRQARERAAKVILECRPELKTLFSSSGCADVVIAYGETIPPFDCFTSLLSLPGILGTTMQTIPNETPYLKVAACEHLPPAPPRHLKVGLAWAGNPSHQNDAARSIRLEELAPLLQTPDATFYSLQVPVPARDEACFRSLGKLLDMSGRFKDFLDTAAAIAAMDLVIAVDTAVAHLAGALAKPTWTLITYSPDWRWLMDRPDTPWYPTMRLFRQAQRDQWQPVILQVAEELGRFTKSVISRPSPSAVNEWSTSVCANEPTPETLCQGVLSRLKGDLCGLPPTMSPQEKTSAFENTHLATFY
ncbi:MAG: tetratricopeptide repeat-containing glycosyltransferase family protein [Syntrophales bacterium]|jgi:tetratricopeptide (TPR) repeat protein